jgi:hypothetical protein
MIVPMVFPNNKMHAEFDYASESWNTQETNDRSMRQIQKTADWDTEAKLVILLYSSDAIESEELGGPRHLATKTTGKRGKENRFDGGDQKQSREQQQQQPSSCESDPGAPPVHTSSRFASFDSPTLSTPALPRIPTTSFSSPSSFFFRFQPSETQHLHAPCIIFFYSSCVPCWL